MAPFPRSRPCKLASTAHQLAKGAHEGWLPLACPTHEYIAVWWDEVRRVRGHQPAFADFTGDGRHEVHPYALAGLYQSFHSLDALQLDNPSYLQAPARELLQESCPEALAIHADKGMVAQGLKADVAATAERIGCGNEEHETILIERLRGPNAFHQKVPGNVCRTFSWTNANVMVSLGKHGPDIVPALYIELNVGVGEPFQEVVHDLWKEIVRRRVAAENAQAARLATPVLSDQVVEVAQLSRRLTGRERQIAASGRKTEAVALAVHNLQTYEALDMTYCPADSTPSACNDSFGRSSSCNFLMRSWPMATTRVVEIDVDQLEPDPENVRSEYDPEIIRGLATFFRDQGTFIENPVVWKVGKLQDGRPLYRAFSGSTRAQAARSIGGKITVQVLPRSPEGSGKLLGQLAAGLVKGDLNPVDIGRSLKRLQDGDRRSVQDLVRELADWGIRRSRSWVFQHLHLADVAPEVQAMVARGEVPIAAVNILYNKSIEDQIRIANGLSDGSLRLADAGATAGASSEAVQGEINRKLAEAASLPESRLPNGRPVVTTDHRHGVVQTRRLLLGIDDPEALSKLAGARAPRSKRNTPPEEWAAQASDEERALAREAFHLGGFTPDQAIAAVDQWQKEAETAPDDLLMAAHSMKRLIDLYARNSESLAKHPGLMRLLRLRATVLSNAAHVVEKRGLLT